MIRPSATVSRLAPGLLRPIEKADNAAMAAVIRSVLTEMGCTGPGIAIHDPEVDALYQTYRSPRSCYFVIEHEGKVAGGGGIAPLKGGDADMCELQKWYILPQYRGFGYGRLLFDRLLDAVKEQGFRRCYVETFGHMKDAAKFYEQSGFRRIDGPIGSTGHFACDRWYVKDM